MRWGRPKGQQGPEEWMSAGHFLPPKTRGHWAARLAGRAPTVGRRVSAPAAGVAGPSTFWGVNTDVSRACSSALVPSSESLRALHTVTSLSLVRVLKSKGTKAGATATTGTTGWTSVLRARIPSSAGRTSFPRPRLTVISARLFFA